MAKKKSTKKTVSKKSKPKKKGEALKKGSAHDLDTDPEVRTSLHKFQRKALRDYLLGRDDEKLTNAEKAKRRKLLAKKLDRSEQTLKNMYAYGQGLPDQWNKVMDHIFGTRQEDIIEFYKLHPVLMEKLSSLSPETRRMYKNVEKMTEEEKSLVNDLIEVGLEKNRAINLGEKPIL